MIKLTLKILLALPLASLALAGPVEDLAPGHWYEAPNSRLESVFPSPRPPGNSGPRAVMSAWSGGAFDSSRDRLLVWGGGHADYSGNEIYAFDIDTLSWQRLTEPSSNVGGSSGSYEYPDGRPRSMHSHGYLSYVPSTDRFMIFGGVAPYPNSGTGDRVFGFSFGSGQWSSSFPDVPSGGKARGSNAVYDPNTGDVWVQTGEDGARLHRFRPNNNQWSSHGGGPWINIYNTAAIDTTRHQFVTIGGNSGNQVLMWDLDNPNSGPVDLTGQTSGADSLESERAPGFQYDPVSDLFVAWDGGADVYTLDPDTWVWRRISPAAGNSVTPPAAANNGTYGRFRYVPSRNVFILANTTDDNVYFYKLSASSGIPQPSVSFSANPDTVGPQGTSTLSWSTTDADACTASGAWSGSKSTPNGTQNVGPLSADSTYTLQCTNSAGGSTTRSVTVTVSGGTTPAPTVSLQADPNSVNSGGTSVLSWSANNANGCTASGDWSGSKPVQGSESRGPLSSDRSYTLTCNGDGGSASRTVAVQVVSVSAPSVSFSADPDVVSDGGTSVLSWNATNADSCSASGGWSGSKGLSGAETVGPLSSDTVFGIQCTGAGGSNSRQLTVSVTGGGGGGGGGGGPLSPAEGTGSTDGALLMMLFSFAALRWRQSAKAGPQGDSRHA